jgi:hypothetical protein
MTTKIDTVNWPVQTWNKSTQNNNLDIEIKKISDSFNSEITSIKSDYIIKIKEVKKESIFWAIVFAILTWLTVNWLYDYIIYIW